MAHKQKLVLQDRFDIDIKTLYEQFCDFTKYGQHHPVMTNVIVVEDKSPDYIEYEVNEEVLLFGFIKIYPNYKAKVIEIEKHKILRYSSQVKKNVQLIVDLHFSEVEGKTVLIEYIEVSANKLVSTIFLNILQKAHLKVYQNIKYHFTTT